MRQSTLLNYNKKSKFLVITSCSKKKLDNSAKAIDLYQGALFKKVKTFALKLGADLKILSAKYGLIDSSQIIEPYNQIIITINDIRALRETEAPKLEKLCDQYTKIIIIMGKKYRKIFEPLILNDNKFLLFYSNKGIGGYLEKMNIINHFNSEDVKNLILGDIE